MTRTNLWRKAITFLFLFIVINHVKAQFGGGTMGSVVISTPNTIINEYTEVSNIDFVTFTIDVNQSSYFSVGKKALLIQMDGGNAGAWEWVHVIQVYSGNVRVLNINNPMDPVTGIVQLIAVPDYADLTITNTGSIIPQIWNGTTGGVVAMMISNVLSIQPGGLIDASGYGFQSGTPGAFGPGGQGGSGGIAPGGDGGNIGVISSTGIGGGGDGGYQGDNGSPGGLAVQTNCTGCAAGAYNAGSAPSNLLMMGGAGYCGDGGDGNRGAGGGGAGAHGSSNGLDGTAGGDGGDGGDGGLGGAGGGIIIVAAYTLDLPSQACMLANGVTGNIGGNATAGGDGGNGGLGGGGCTVGGGGGGGNGGYGGNGGGGGSGGAGGMIKTIRHNSSPAPLSFHREVNGGFGAAGGSGANGGQAGTNGGNLNGMTCFGNGGSGGNFNISGICHAGLVLDVLQNMGVAGANNGVYSDLGNGFHLYTNGTDSLYMEEIDVNTTLVYTFINGLRHFTIVIGSVGLPSPHLTVDQIFTLGTISYPTSQYGQVFGSLGTYDAICAISRSQAQSGQSGNNGPNGVDAGPGDVSDDITEDCTQNQMIIAVDTTVPFTCPETPAEIQVTVLGGGTPGFTYTYIGASIIEQNNSGIFMVDDSPGEIIVTDAEGCVSDFTPAQADIDQMFIWSPISTTPSCYGSATGQVLLELDPSYDAFLGFIADVYYVSDVSNINTYYPTYTSPTTITFDGLAPGQYFIYQQQCFYDPLLSFEILEFPEIQVIPTITNETCNSGGTIELSINGGSAPYDILWSNGQTVNPLVGLSAQTISATITDAQGCTFNDSYTIGSSSASLNISFQNTPETCGQVNGSSLANVTGGTGPFIYSWSNGTSGPLLQHVSAGNYELQVTDANGCISTAETEILSVGINPMIQGSITHVSCNGAANGDVTITVTGGTAPYTYSWSSGSATNSNQNGQPGVYTVVVTTADGCSANSNFEITEPDPLVIQANVTQPNCTNTTGSIDVTITGGTTGAGILYNWSNGFEFEDLFGINPGSYTLQVTDNNGCTSSATYHIVSPTPPIISSIITNDYCGNQSGAIDLTITSSNLPLDITWSNGSTTEDISGLAAGVYTVLITDANMCSAYSTISIDGPVAPITISNLQTINLNCFGDQNGSVFTTVTGGFEPYTFSWSNGSTGQHLIGVGAGTYSLTVTDDRGCQQTASFTVTQPSTPLQAILSGDQVLCSGQAGLVNVTGSGGTAPYFGEGLRTIYSGMNQITLYDAFGCSATENWFVTAVANPVINFVTTPDCGGTSTGSIITTVTSGTPSYIYSWSDGASTPNRTSIPGGDYTLNVIDANGCITEGKVNVPVSPPMILSGQVTHAFCSPANSGAIDLTVTGGTPAYAYSWSNGAITQDISGLVAGTYHVTVTDQYGCTSTSSFVVQDGCLCPVNFNVEICGPSEICQGENFTLISQVTPRTQGYPVTYAWSRTPATFTSTASSITQNGLPAGTYTYTLVVTYSPVCTATVQHTVLVRARPTISVTNALTNTNAQAVQLAGCNIILNATGGNYYNWTYAGNTFPTHSSQLIDGNTNITTNSQTRTYSVVGIDQYGCSNSANIQVILRPLVITGNYSSAPAGPNVTVSGNITTAFTNASYTWNGPGGYVSGPSTTIRNFSRVGLMSALNGTYTATVIQNGCVKTATFQLTENAQIIKSLILEDGTETHEIQSSDTFEWIDNTSIENPEASKILLFDLYPNPGRNQINVVGRNEFLAYTMIKIYDLQGNLLTDITLGEKQDIQETIDITNLASGSYILRLDCGENGSWQKVFVKEN